MQDFIDDVFAEVGPAEGRQCAECTGVAEPDDSLCGACLIEQCYVEFCEGGCWEFPNPDTMSEESA